jgi:hypothetical protein
VDVEVTATEDGHARGGSDQETTPVHVLETSQDRGAVETGRNHVENPPQEEQEKGLVRPRSFRVGPYSYEVRYSPHVRDADRPNDQRGLWGFQNSMEQYVEVFDGLQEERIRAVFMHEALHAVADAVSMPLNEKEIGWLAPALVDFLRRNPEVARWLIQ